MAHNSWMDTLLYLQMNVSSILDTVVGIPPLTDFSTPPISSSVSPDSAIIAHDIVEQKVMYTLLICRGCSFLKYGRTGKPHLDDVKVSTDLSKVFWGKKHVPASELLEVKEGRQSVVFQKYDQANHTGLTIAELNILSSLSFSLIFSSRTLDLQLEYNPKKSDPSKLERDQRNRDAWVNAFKWLLAQKTKGIEGIASPIRISLQAAFSSEQRQSVSAPQTPLVTSAPPAADNSLVSPSGALAHASSAGSGSPFLGPAASNTPLSPAIHGPPSTLMLSPNLNSPADSGISRPQNVVRTTHVNQNFHWERERLDEDFTLVRKLGAGAFAEVWLARHNLLGFEVAVKTVQLSSDPKRAVREREEIKSEIAILQLCKNRYICGFLGCCPTPDSQNRLWILMDHFSRGSIINLITHSTQRLIEPEIAYIIHSVLFGLTYLNSRNVSHRDIKSRNILINEKGEVALADFGVSKILNHSQGASNTNTNTNPSANGSGVGEEKTGSSQPTPDIPTAPQTPLNIAGSPCFMSPEVVCGKPPDLKADIWSLGIVCLELANSGRVPHDDLPTPFRIMRAIKTSAPPSLHWIPTPLAAPGAQVVSCQGPTPIWSTAFHDFVSRCLEPDSTLRADAVSLLSHPFVSGAFSPTVMQAQLKAYDEAERKRLKRLRKNQLDGTDGGGGGRAAGGVVANQRQVAKPSILDSLFKLLGRKGPTQSVKLHVDALREKGKLDEMGEDLAVAGGGGNGAQGNGADDVDAGDDTVVLNGGSDTTVMQPSSDSENEVDHSTVTSASAEAPSLTAPTSSATPSASPAGSPVSSTQTASVGAELPHASASSSSNHAPRRSIQGETLVRCTTAQLAALGAEVGIDSKLMQQFLLKVTTKYGTLVPSTSSTGAGANRSQTHVLNTPAARRHLAQHQSMGGGMQTINPSSSAAASDEDEDGTTTAAPLSLFQGCTPSLDSEESAQQVAELELSTVMVCGLSRSDLTSLKRMTNAPPPVRMAIESVALVLGIKPLLMSGPSSRKGGMKQRAIYDYWQTAQAVLVRPNFLTLLKSYDFTRHLSPEIIDRLFEFAYDKPASYTPEVVASSSTTAGILWRWTRAVFQYAVHCIGYKPEGWTAEAEATALTVKSEEDPSVSPSSFLGLSHTSSSASKTSSLLSPSAHSSSAGKSVRRHSSQHFDPSAVNEITSSGTSSGVTSATKNGAHRRGSFGSSYPSLNIHAPASTLPLNSPLSAPTSQPIGPGSGGVGPARLRRISSGTSSVTGSGAVSESAPSSGRESPSVSESTAAASNTEVGVLTDASATSNLDGGTTPGIALKLSSDPVVKSIVTGRKSDPGTLRKSSASPIGRVASSSSGSTSSTLASAGSVKSALTSRKSVVSSNSTSSSGSLTSRVNATKRSSLPPTHTPRPNTAATTVSTSASTSSGGKKP